MTNVIFPDEIIINEKILYEMGITIYRTNTCIISKNISPNMLNHYVRGVFDSNGFTLITDSNNLNIRFGIRFPSKLYIENLQQIFMDKCELKKTKILNAGDTFILIYGGNKQCMKIFKWLYNDATIYSEKKWKIFSDYITMIELRNKNKEMRRSFLAAEKEKWRELKKIKREEKKKLKNENNNRILKKLSEIKKESTNAIKEKNTYEKNIENSDEKLIETSKKEDEI